MIQIIPAFINSIAWGIKPVIEKLAITQIDHTNFTFVRYIISGILSFIFLNILIFIRNKNYKSIYNLDFIKKSAYWGTIVSLIGILAIGMNYYLLSKFNVHQVTAIVEASLIIFNVIFSVIILKETVTITRMIGIFVIIIGIVLVNYG